MWTVGPYSVLNVPGEMMPSLVTFAQDETRVDETVALLKAFYKGENPNVPWPQVRGVLLVDVGCLSGRDVC